MTTEITSASLPECIQRYDSLLEVQRKLKRDIDQLKKQVEHHLRHVPKQSLPTAYGKILLQKRCQRGPVTQAYVEASLIAYLQRHTQITETEARHCGKAAAAFIWNERPQTASIALFRYVSKRKGAHLLSS